MQTFYFRNKIWLLSIFSLLFVAPAHAQDAAKAAQTSTQSTDPFPIVLICIAGVLAFVIWGLARVLLLMAQQSLNKKKVPKVLPAILVAVCLLSVQLASAQDTVAGQATKEVAKTSPGFPALYYILFAVITLEFIVIVFLAASIQRFTADLIRRKKRKSVAEGKRTSWWTRFEKKLTGAVPLENEQDVVMDHEYDGIRELDNALPPWWKYGFYISIGFAIVYFLNYSVLGYGKNPTEEYNAQMAKAKIEQANYDANNKDKIDENNVPMADAAGLAVAKEIFTTKCFACHGKLGEGGAGPNLTDNYWLHKGSLNDIYQSIKHGYPDKGMQAWSAVYTPKEISDLASYIETLHGTNPPNAKAPQGDLYEDSKSGAKPGDTKPDTTK